MNRTIHNPVLQDSVTFVRTSAETGGEVTDLDVTLMPGGGNPLHFHTSYTELFTVVEGELGVSLADGTKLSLGPGEAQPVSLRQVHRFFNASDRPVRFRTELRPGHAGFEQGLRIVYGLAADSLCNRKGIPRKLEHMALFVEMSDIHPVGLPALLGPLLKRIAARARRKGVEAELLARYCR